jgi:hypothetical protein
MNSGRLAVPALLILVALMPAPALAGARIYDMTPLLNEPDPFQPVVPPTYRPGRAAPASLPRSVPQPVPMATAPPRVSSRPAMPALASSPPPSLAPVRASSPVAPTPLMVPVGREPPSASMLRPVGLLPAGMTPQR